MFCNMIGLTFKPCLLLEASMYVIIYSIKGNAFLNNFHSIRHLILLQVRRGHETMDLAEVNYIFLLSMTIK